LIIEFDRNSQQRWHFERVDNLVAARSYLARRPECVTTGVCDVVDLFDAKRLPTAAGAVSPLPRRGIDTPTRSITEDQAGALPYVNIAGWPNQLSA
jgi:hypothetical protein